MSDSSDWQATSGTLDGLRSKTNDLTAAVGSFSKVMTQAFASSITSGKQFEDVLKSLALKLSSLAVQSAFKPLDSALGGYLQALTAGRGGGTGEGTTQLFAAGGVIGAPSYFPLSDGGTGLAGEAGPEAIMPLQRGPDGRLGVAGGGGGHTINVSIATPDADSFRRSESFITGQIARAVARGQRSL
jgi:phage-related minor tail protein